MTVQVPTTLDEAVGLLAETPQAALLAGGTDLMVEINAGHRRADTLIALDRVSELRGCSLRHSTLTVMSGTTYAALESGQSAQLAPALAQAGRTVGSPQIRNAATIGGNLATCSPAGDGLPVLAALEASVVLRSATGSRTLTIGDFMVGVKRTALRPDELIERVDVPVVHGWQGYAKVGVRNAMVIAVASTALVLDRTAKQIRIALGSVGPTVLRCTHAEGWVNDRIDWDRPDAEHADTAALASEFGRLVALESRPIDDHRSTAAYRRHAVSVMAQRQLRRALSAPAGEFDTDV